ncbi:MAG: hypothetical protein E7050_10320 [Lentisphaerae bacterium]|nr:hypothetical protein [Lentisphaerota bacterium]
MKKFLIGGMAAVAALAFTGCKMCCEPIANDPTCIENSHYTSVGLNPAARTMVSPNLGASKQLFRPVFKAGTERISVIGKGTDYDSAVEDAYAKFLAQTNCDYVVAVTTVVSEKTHPTWRFWATTNYSVTLSGLPMYLEKLDCETLTPEKVVLESTTNTNGSYAGELRERSTGEATRKDVDLSPLNKIEKSKVDNLVSGIVGKLF